MWKIAALAVALLAVTFCRVDANPQHQPDPWIDVADPLVREQDPIRGEKPLVQEQEPIWGEEDQAIARLDENENDARPFAAEKDPNYDARTWAEDEERENNAGTWDLDDDRQGIARPWAMEEETYDEGEQTRFVREADDPVKGAGASVEHEGKKYELPDDFDKSTIDDETDLNKILEDYKDKVDDELKGGLNYIAASNASDPDGKYTDCHHHYTAGARVNGVYTIHPRDTDTAFDVWCDFYTSTGQGWTVISKRFDGNVFFYRNYATYRAGFGALHSEFWLGLEKMRQISHQEPYILRVDMWDCDDSHRFAQYDYFALGPSASNYELLLGIYSGDAGDSLGFHRYQKFSAYDVDNDGYSGNCAGLYKGGWWYNDCYESHLNGLYYNCDDNGVPPGHTGMTWKTFGGYSASLPRVEMKIMPYS